MSRLTHFISALLLGTSLLCSSAQAEPFSIDINGLQDEVSLRLEVGDRPFDYGYSEQWQVDRDRTLASERDMQNGDYYRISFLSHPEDEVCSASNLTGEYVEGETEVNITCYGRRVSVYTIQSFNQSSDNSIVADMRAVFRDTNQPVTGLLKRDFDIIQDEGESDELRFSAASDYYYDLLPYPELNPGFHWILAFDVSFNVTASELANIKSQAKALVSRLAGNEDLLPPQIRLTISSFAVDFVNHVSESRSVQELHDAIDSIGLSNQGTDLYGGVFSALAQLSTTFRLSSVEYGGVIVVTESTDTAGINSVSTVTSARGTKSLYFVGVGDEVNVDELNTMVGSDYPDRVATQEDFTTLDTTIFPFLVENVGFVDGSYLMLATSPLRDSTSHTLDSQLNNQVTCAEQELEADTVPTCVDKVTGSYQFTSSVDTKRPVVFVLGENRLANGHSKTLTPRTLWVNEEGAYNVTQSDAYSELSTVIDTDTGQVTSTMEDSLVSTELTFEDIDWNISGSQTVMSPGEIVMNDDTNEQTDITQISLDDDNTFVNVTLVSANAIESANWNTSLQESDALTVDTLAQTDDSLQLRIRLDPNALDGEQESSLTVTDSNNFLEQVFTIIAQSDSEDSGINPIPSPDPIPGPVPVIPDEWYERYGLDPSLDGADGDADGDGLSNAQEFLAGSNPTLVDSDFDGISDVLEARMQQSTTIARHQVSLGYDHSCILDDDGLDCVMNDVNAFNSGVDDVPALNNAVLLSSGQSFSCAVDDNGLVCWGVDTDSVLNAPLVSQVDDLDSGFRHSCVISGSEVQCWGPDGNDILSPPTGLDNPSNLSVGTGHACLLDDSGPVCWGDNQNGQIDVPFGLQSVSEIVAGQFHTCAIASDSVVCWGATRADFGQLDIPTLVNPRNLRSAENAVCVDTDNGLTCWGERLAGFNLNPFNDRLYLTASYDIHPNATGLCAIDLQGLKCVDGFGETVTEQSFEFTEKRAALPMFNYGGAGNDVIAVWEPETFSFNTLGTAGALLSQTVFTSELNDIPIAGDFDGDGIVDAATRRPGNNTWYILNSGGSNMGSSLNDGIQRISFGSQASDIPVPGDYDGDSIADIAFWRPSNGIWYIRNSSDTNLGSEREDGIQRQLFGRQATDIPLPGDFDGDRINDLSFWRASNQTWYVKNSSDGQFGSDRQDGIQRFTFDVTDNIENYQPTMADFDGDGITDMALVNSETGQWLIRQSSTLQTISIDFPESINGLPMPADYTGDGMADLTVWDAVNTSITLRDSSSENVSQFSYGTQQSIPLAIIPTERLALAQNVTD